MSAPELPSEDRGPKWYFDLAYGYLGETFDICDPRHIDMAGYGRDAYVAEQRKKLESRRSAARHRRYRSAALLNRRGAGRWA